MARFEVTRSNLRDARWVASADEPPTDGQVRMQIDAFALTANNITDAAFGEAMQYWQFFPTADAATGCIPVWGFAAVAESRCADVAVGERIYYNRYRFCRADPARPARRSLRCPLRQRHPVGAGHGAM